MKSRYIIESAETGVVFNSREFFTRSEALELCDIISDVVGPGVEARAIKIVPMVDKPEHAAGTYNVQVSYPTLISDTLHVYPSRVRFCNGKVAKISSLVDAIQLITDFFV